MVIIDVEGKLNDNTYLFDGKFLNSPHFLSVYIIENNGMRLMIDTPSESYVRKFLKKLQELGLYPIHKIILTHSHCDHISGAARVRRMIKDVDVEILASENAIDNLRTPEKMNDAFGIKVTPVENVIPLKEGDIINLNGLKLEVFNLFGHTMDSIGILDKNNKNLFPGDSTMIRFDNETFFPMYFPPDFHESEQLKAYQKLKNIRDEYDSISLPHFGTWKDDGMDKLLNEMEDLYFKSKEAFMEWYKEKHSIEDITLKYHDTFIPNSKIVTKENIMGFKLFIGWLIDSLKISGFIE
jgi:glyoxylase-like metal-dependent hydrolase (beta-lactamase superfamily II)